MLHQLRLSVLLIIVGSFLLGSISCQPRDRLRSESLQIKNGMIQGYTEEGVHIFKGIPFAEPPVGELRWQAPQPPKDWTGIKDCSQFSASPIQTDPKPFMMWTEEFLTPPGNLSEDCLYLNVWSAAKSTQEKRPVLVWIYGGGFVSGSGACPIYDGLELAKQGVVYVTINYRVGLFGFMAHSELSQEADYGTSGNYAILDQIAALKWVQENIAAFGGDPEQVTIAGQSAGAFSVNALIASPLAKGLFHQAIMQSGGMMKTNRNRSLAEAEKDVQAYMESKNIQSLQELRALSADEIFRLGQGLRMGIVLDGHVLPSDIGKHFQERRHNDVPVLTGWVSKDGGLGGNQFPTQDSYSQYLENRFSKQAEEAENVFGGGEDYLSGAEKLFLCDFAVLQSHLLAQSSQHPAYLYEFSFVPTDKPDFPNYGAFHSSEIPYALHTLAQWKRPWKARDLDMEQLMSTYWINFTKTGNPNVEGLPKWEVYQSAKGNVLELGEETQMRSRWYLDELQLLSQTRLSP